MHPKGIDIVQEIGGFCIVTGEQYVSIVHYLYNKCTICTVRHKEVGSYDIHAKSLLKYGRKNSNSALRVMDAKKKNTL